MTDILLLLSPVMILRSVHLDPGLHLRLVAVFSISVVATIFSIIHVVLALTVGGIVAGLFGLLEVCEEISFYFLISSDFWAFQDVCCNICLQYLRCGHIYYGTTG